MGKQIVYFEDGVAKEIYNSIKEASLATGIDERNIVMCVRGYWKGYKNLDFKYLVTAPQARELYWKNKK